MDQFNYPKFKAFDSNGAPLVGGKLYTYHPGTTDDKDTYNYAGSALTNPVILDSNGEAMIYTDGEYDLILTDSDDVTIWTLSSAGGSAVSAASGGTATVANEIAVFANTDAISIIGGAAAVAKSGGVQLNENVLLIGGANDVLHVRDTEDTGYGDVVAKDITVGKITGVGAVSLTGATAITGAVTVTGAISATTDVTAHRHVLLGTGHPIITAGTAGAALDSTTAVQVRNAGNTDYADLYCKSLIQTGSVTGDSKFLLLTGRADPLFGGSISILKTSGLLTATPAKVIAGTAMVPVLGVCRVTVSGINLLTGTLVFLNSFGALSLGTAQSLATGATPYTFNGTLVYTYTDPPQPNNIWRIYQSYPYASGGTPAIVDMSATTIDFQTSCYCRQWMFSSVNAGSTWLYIGPTGVEPLPVFDANQVAALRGSDVSWISVYIQN